MNRQDDFDPVLEMGGSWVRVQLLEEIFINEKSSCIRWFALTLRYNPFSSAHHNRDGFFLGEAHVMGQNDHDDQL